jgi:superfamily II DNA or RNA helicase
MSSKRKSQAGAYIAGHFWLDLISKHEGKGPIYKVGHSGDLGRRLLDSSYTTCFPPGWRYEVTYETATKDAAELIEAKILAIVASNRLSPRELVQGLDVSALRRVAADAIVALKVRADERMLPEYEPPEYLRPEVKQTEDECPGAPPTTPVIAPQPVVEEEDRDFSSLLDELSDGFSGMTIEPEEVKKDDVPPIDLTEKFAVCTPPRVPPPGLNNVTTPSPPLRPVMLSPGLRPFEGEDEPADLGLPTDLVMPGLGSVEERDYQVEAANNCMAELQRTGRAILQVACRCGKTYIAHRVRVLGKYRAVLLLVPGLPLLRQTAQKLAAYAGGTFDVDDLLLVGSDPVEVPLHHGVGPEGRQSEPTTKRMTTDRGAVEAFLKVRGRPRTVVCMYQSSQLIPAAAPIDLIIFDEAHKIVGPRRPRPSNFTLLSRTAGHRLFMTATPDYDPNNELSMSDRKLFGGIAYRYYLRQGIDHGYVNDFRMELIASPPAEKGAATSSLPTQIVHAMGRPGMDKMLVFCKNIKHANMLSADVTRTLVGARDDTKFACLVAHSNMNKKALADILREFSAPGVRAVLFNCRMFQEGVEIPTLNGVLFASPRRSHRDIIQSVCRPLNALPGKPPAIVFVPVTVGNPDNPDNPDDCRRLSEVTFVFDALASEDPRLYEHLLDPSRPFPLDCFGTGEGAPRTPQQRAALLSVMRKCVRRTQAGGRRGLLRNASVPWVLGFAELRRVVVERKQYPISTAVFQIGEEKLNLNGYWKWCAEEYVKWRAGQQSKLEPAQARQLELLPGWIPFGVEGPYPWGYCMKFLEQWLEENGGVPPMVSVSSEEYFGLDATDVERLSGCLRCINQQDGERRGEGYASARTKLLKNVSKLTALAKATPTKTSDETETKTPVADLSLWNACLNNALAAGKTLFTAATGLAVPMGTPRPKPATKPKTPATPPVPFVSDTTSPTGPTTPTTPATPPRAVAAGLKVALDKQRDLDRICAKYGLVWRKTRTPDDHIVSGDKKKTFIQQANDRLRAYHKAWVAGENDGSYITRWFTHGQFSKTATPKKPAVRRKTPVKPKKKA